MMCSFKRIVLGEISVFVRVFTLGFAGRAGGVKGKKKK